MNSVHEPGSRTMSKNRLRNRTESNRAKIRLSAPSAQPTGPAARPGHEPCRASRLPHPALAAQRPCLPAPACPAPRAPTACAPARLSPAPSAPAAAHARSPNCLPARLLRAPRAPRPPRQHAPRAYAPCLMLNRQ